MKIELRPYQSEAIDRTLAAAERGVRRQLGVAATGLGKTVIFVALARAMGCRALVLAHRDELVQQAAAKVRELWPDVSVGIVKAGDDEVHAQVVVASVQTLARPSRLARLVAAADADSVLGPGPFGLVIVDEAHHATADSYRAVIAALNAGATPCTIAADHTHDRPATPGEVTAGCELGVAVDPCPGPHPPLLLGVTATPDRGDGKGLDDVFEQITWSYDLLWGIRSGFLADVRGKRITLEALDLSKVRISRGDFQAGDAGRALEDADAPAAIVQAWMEHAGGRRTLVFTPTVAVAQQVADEFNAAGIAAGWVSGETPRDERAATLAAYSAGRLHVVANCAVLTEGYDEPRTDCVIVARPTRSRALYAQMVGRGTRKHPDKIDCLVLDVVGVTTDLSLATVPTLFGLEQQFAERMGDGSGLASEVIADQEAEFVRLGRIRAEDVELFAKVRAAAGIAWVQVHKAGADRRRYVRSVGGATRDSVVLQEHTDGTWVAGVAMENGSKRLLIGDVSLEYAQGVAEDYLRKHAPAALVNADAPWRQRRPSPRQLAAAKKWGIKVDPSWTAGEVSDALDARIARRKRHAI